MYVYIYLYIYIYVCIYIYANTYVDSSHTQHTRISVLSIVYVF